MTNLQRAKIKINVMIDSIESRNKETVWSDVMVNWLNELKKTIEKDEVEECGFCGGNKILKCEEGSQQAEAEVYFGEGYMNFVLTENFDDPQEQTETEFTFRIDNCPMCGRKFEV